MKLEDELKRGKLHKVYIFIGTDHALIRKRITRIANVVCQDMPKSLQIDDETQWNGLLLSLRRRTLFSKNQLEIAMLSFVPKTVDFDFPVENHLIVISGKSICFKQKDCYMENMNEFNTQDYKKYIKYLFKQYKKTADGAIINEIYSICGRDLAKIDNNVLKLVSYISSRKTINIDDLSILDRKESSIWINLNSENLIRNDNFIKQMEISGKPPHLVIGIIFSALRKSINNYNQRQFDKALKLLEQADVAIKRSDQNSGFLILRQLLLKLHYEAT